MSDLKIVQGNDGLLDMDQASKYLNIKKDTLYSYCFKRIIPVVKIGKLNRFRMSDLERWVNEHVQESRRNYDTK